MRKTPLVTGEYYHIFNRGVDKRQIFMSAYDLDRFMKSLIEFNTTEPIGSLYEHSFKKPPLGGLVSKYELLVQIIAYCLNPNHFHVILQQVADGGISKFLHKVGADYTRYFNDRYERSGALFQGSFKSVHIENNEQLLYVSAYVNLNNHVHKPSHKNLPVCSSWSEYVIRDFSGICKKDIILSQFKGGSAYEKFAKETVASIRKQRELSGDVSLKALPLRDMLKHV